MDNYHVVKKDDGWALLKEGSERPIRTADTKAEIMVQMREYMSDKIGSVKIHTEQGSIQEERTYQRKDDPVKSKG